jgi:LiaF transmembrane domain
MRIRRGLLGWGVFLILAGAIPLAVRAGYISNDDLSRYWSLWPLILIGIGVGLILSRTSFDFVGGLIVAATVGVMVGGLLSAGVSGFGGASCGSTAATTAFPARDGTFGSTGDVEVRLDCGDLTVGVGQGSGWHLEGSDTHGTGPTLESDASTLDVRSRHEGGPSWLGFGDHDTWRLTVPATPRLGLDVQVNAGRGTIGLAGATLGEVGLQLNAGSATLDLGSVAAISTIDLQLNAGSLGVTLPNLSLTGSIQANAGSVKVCVPPEAGLRLHTGESIIASYDYAGHGLVQDGSTWTTPGFDSAPVKIDLETKANAGSFTLDPEGGCG